MNSNRNLDKLLRVIFPEVLMEYFDISGWHDGSDKIEVWLDEKHYLERSDYKSGTVISHGFTDEKVILRTLRAYDNLPKEIQEGISQVKYAPSKSNDQLLNLYMNDGNQVIVNINNLANQMKYYSQVAKDMDEKNRLQRG